MYNILYFNPRNQLLAVIFPSYFFQIVLSVFLSYFYFLITVISMSVLRNNIHTFSQRNLNKYLHKITTNKFLHTNYNHLLIYYRIVFAYFIHTKSINIISKSHTTHIPTYSQKNRNKYLHKILTKNVLHTNFNHLPIYYRIIPAYFIQTKLKLIVQYNINLIAIFSHRKQNNYLINTYLLTNNMYTPYLRDKVIYFVQTIQSKYQNRIRNYYIILSFPKSAPNHLISKIP